MHTVLSSWIRYQLLSQRGLYQLLVRDGCKEFKLGIVEKSRSTLWPLLIFFHQPEKSSLCLQTVQSPFFCPPCSFFPIWISSCYFFVEKQILSKSHLGDSEMSYMKNMDGCIWVIECPRCPVQLFVKFEGFCRYISHILSPRCQACLENGWSRNS